MIIAIGYNIIRVLREILGNNQSPRKTRLADVGSMLNSRGLSGSVQITRTLRLQVDSRRYVWVNRVY